MILIYIATVISCLVLLKVLVKRVLSITTTDEELKIGIGLSLVPGMNLVLLIVLVFTVGFPLFTKVIDIIFNLVKK